MTILLASCVQSKPQTNYIVPCKLPTDLVKGATFADLIDKYLETRDNLSICVDRVRKHNENVERN